MGSLGKGLLLENALVNFVLKSSVPLSLVAFWPSGPKKSTLGKQDYIHQFLLLLPVHLKRKLSCSYPVSLLKAQLIARQLVPGETLRNSLISKLHAQVFHMIDDVTFCFFREFPFVFHISFCLSFQNLLNWRKPQNWSPLLWETNLKNPDLLCSPTCSPWVDPLCRES